MLDYYHCFIMCTVTSSTHGFEAQANRPIQGKEAQKDWLQPQQEGEVMTDEWYLCIDHIRSLSTTDAKWAQSKCKQTKEPRLPASWGLVPSLWAKFSKETGQTQQTPNNYSLAYTEAWNHTNSLSKEAVGPVWWWLLPLWPCEGLSGYALVSSVLP